MSSGGQRNGVPCKDEGGAQRLGSKKLHVSFDTIMKMVLSYLNLNILCV